MSNTVSIWGLTLAMSRENIETIAIQNSLKLKPLYPSIYVFYCAMCVCRCEVQPEYPLWTPPETSGIYGDDFVNLPQDGEHPWVNESLTEIVSGDRAKVESRIFLAGQTSRREIESSLGKPMYEVDRGGGQLSLAYQFDENQLLHLLVRPNGILRICTIARPGRRIHIWSEWLSNLE